MDNVNDSGSILPIAAVIALLTIIGFSFNSGSSFKDSTQDTIENHQEQHNYVSARLWQDPFEAVYDYRKKSGNNGNGFNLTALRQDIRYRKPVSILSVMLPSVRYDEDKETRIRLRYAVLGALQNIGYFPEDSNRIQYAIYAQNNRQSPSDIIAYEWHMKQSKSKHGPEQYIVLMWLNEEAFRAKPLARLSGMIHGSGIDKDRFHLIGPQESEVLKNMIDDLDQNLGLALNGIHIYSAFATAPDEYLTSNGEATKELFRKKCIHFSRIIKSDELLAHAMVEELKTRGMKAEDKSRFLIISEAGSLHSRSLRDLYSEVLKENFDVTGSSMRYINYFRGLDGSLPGKKAAPNMQSQALDDKQEKNGNEQETKQDIELPYGTSQYDYIRRSMDRIHRFEERRNKYIDAIIILGSDFNDKNLILQAARQFCPQALCFTTDIDARWNHPSNIAWSRNLIVASYGVDLKSLVRKKKHEDSFRTLIRIPSFRDVYQTSAYLATLKALNNKVNLEYFGPTIFEIGRKHAIDLTHKMTEKQDLRIVLALGLTVVLLVFLFLFKPESIAYCRKYGVRLIIITGFTLITTISIVTLFIHFLSNNPQEEMFSLVEGISIWPSNILNIMAFFLSIGFLIYAHNEMKSNVRKIGHTYFKRESGTYCTKDVDDFDKQKFIDVLKEYKSNLMDIRYETKKNADTDPDRPSNLVDKWRKYLEYNNIKRRVARTTALSLLYLIFSIAVVHYLGPLTVPPVRGRWSILFTGYINYASGISFVILMAYVLDATRQCRYFIANISSRPPDWQSAIHYDHESLNELRLARLIAMRTEAVMKLIYYPLIVWSVLVIARSSYFDYWSSSLGLALATSLGVLITWLCAVFMRYDAENYRQKALMRLREQEIKVVDDPKQREFIQHAKECIEKLQQGSFAPFMQQPVFRSVLLGIASVGGSSLGEIFSVFNV